MPTAAGAGLAGRAVVVTGAGRGLGLAIARRLGEAGARIWLGDVRADWGEEAAEKLVAEGIDARFVPVDLRDPASVDRFADAITSDGPLWGLVNNAALADGVGGRAIHELSVDEWDRVLDVNLRGTFLVSRAFAPALIESGGGRVVMIGSDAALYGSPRLAHYIASKGGVAALSRAMARDLGPTASQSIPSRRASPSPSQRRWSLKSGTSCTGSTVRCHVHSSRKTSSVPSPSSWVTKPRT